MSISNCSEERAAASFFHALQTRLRDTRDTRGRRLGLPFVLTSVVLTLLSGCVSLSSTHRFLEARLLWLRRLTGLRCAPCPSRAHLPLLLAGLDLNSFEALLLQHFGVPRADCGWVALDGKTLRGISRGNQRPSAVFAVAHDTAQEVSRRAQVGEKDSEVAVVREMLARDLGRRGCS